MLVVAAVEPAYLLSSAAHESVGWMLRKGLSKSRVRESHLLIFV
jgi:hypothetical protein